MKKHHLLKHGMYKTKIYRTWVMMRDTARYSDEYMDPRWDDFVSFWEDVGDRPEEHALIRKVLHKGFYKDNVRWVNVYRNDRPLRSDLDEAIKKMLLKMDGESFKSTAAKIGIHYKTFLRFIDGEPIRKDNFNLILEYLG